jgi:hypothetical protein
MDKVKIRTWIIVDKHRKVVACGSPRNRELCLIDGLKKRIMTYGTRGKAMSGITMSGFYDFEDYIEKTYGKRAKCEDYLEPVECVIEEL